MTTNLCPCADLDWRDADMTLEHHPECKANEVQALTIDAPPVGGLIDVGSRYWRFGESGAVPFDGTKGYVDLASDRLVAHDEIQMPSCENGKFYTLGYTLTNEWGNASTVVEFLHCGLKQRITFPGFKRELSCLKCEAVAVFPEGFEF